MKVCSTCKVEKPRDEFFPRPERPIGIRSSCKACEIKKRVIWEQENPEKQAVALAKHYRARRAAQTSEQRRCELDRYTANAANWRTANPGKNAASVAKWSAAHPEKASVRRAAKLNATAAWGDPFLIRGIYALARMATERTGIEWEVDHVIPLVHPLVCGLHVENNLQIITATKNRSKGNRWSPEVVTRI